MFDIRLIRENAKLVKENIKKKYEDDKLALVDELIEKDLLWRNIKSKTDDLRHERNAISAQINKLKKEKKDASDLIAKAKEIPGKIEKSDKEADALKSRIDDILKTIPNIIHESVPIGKNDSENVVREVLGEPTKLAFEPKSHVELCEKLGIADFDASSRVAGNGFFYLKGALSLLNQALIRFSIDFMVSKGYTFVEPPLMLRQNIVDGTVDFNFFKDMVYKIENEDLYLIGTSEHALIGMFNSQIIDESELPLKLCGYSQCFRKEIGSHGIDEKGLFRTHQFNKVEQVVICKPEASYDLYDELMNNSKEIYKALGLPARVLESCSGDLGDLKAKGADLEVFSPRSKSYFEVGSCSNLTDAQARRSNIRIRARDGSLFLPHTLNNTAVATSRAMVAIIENFQTEKGTVIVPEILRPYMHGLKEITADWKEDLKKLYNI